MPWDIYSIGTAASVANNFKYTVEKQTVLVLLGFVLLIAAESVVNLEIRKNGQKKVSVWGIRAVGIAIAVALLCSFTHTLHLDSTIRKYGMYDKLFTPTVMSKRDGTAVAFLMELKYVSVDKPTNYSASAANQILEPYAYKIESDTSASSTPNIIVIMNEAFSDPAVLAPFETNQEYMPYVHSILDGSVENTISGYLNVSVLGGNTANTEFESITGMSLRYFGAGEYPYKSILKEETCESAAYVLKELGYGTHAIHNNEANFYGRRTVFARLGFDTFTSEEYMPDISDTTEMGWVKDHILTDEIVKAMESTEGPDYVYTISVQGHGDYPEEPVLTDPVIQVSGAESQEKNYAWEYYVNQLYEMDQFVKELTDRLAEYDERVVLVMYGDHLPTMDLKVEDMKNRYLFQTKYVMWSNFEMKKKDKNLAAYQMAAEVFNRLGIHEGTVFNYHQTRKGSRNYQLDLQALQYDILYGKRYVYGGENPFSATKIQLGTNPAVFESIVPAGMNSYYVYGENFTASSRLEVNNELKETTYLNPGLLFVQNVELSDGDEIAVATQSNSSTKKVLSRTGTTIYHIPEPEVTPEPASTPEPEETNNTSEVQEPDETQEPEGQQEQEAEKNRE